MIAKKFANVVGGRFAPGRLPLVAMIIALVALAVPAALVWDSTDATPSGSKDQTTEAHNPCEEAREKCASLNLNGRDWRYSLNKATVPTTRTVIVDLGGPGIAPLSGTYHLGLYRGQLTELNEYNLLVIEEPWVTAPLSDACRFAATAYYQSARTSTGDLVSTAEKLHDACDIGSGSWGFQPQTYAQVVAGIISKESLDLKGFIGHSFGVVRYSYLSGSSAAHSLEWAVLARPFPVGIDATTFVSRRAELTEALFGSASGNDTPAASSPSRSLQVTRFDHLSALVGLGYAAAGEEVKAAEAVVHKQDPEAIGRFSDNLWHRYGTDSISPAYLAQLDEVCAATTSSDKLNNTEGSPVNQIITKLLLPCAGEASKPPTFGKQPTCIVASKADPVVAGDAAVGILKQANPGVVVFDSAKASHNSVDGLQYCLKEMLKSS